MNRRLADLVELFTQEDVDPSIQQLYPRAVSNPDSPHLYQNYLHALETAKNTVKVNQRSIMLCVDNDSS